MYSKSWRIFVVIGIMIMGCNNIRPELSTGPVIDVSKIVSVTTFNRGLTTPPVTLFVKHFHYFKQPAAYQLLSVGSNLPVTLFEEFAVYATSPVINPISGSMPSRIFTRVFSIPNIQTSGQTPPRFLLAPRQLLPATSNLVVEPRVLVYLEGGPIYGGLTINGLLDPQVTAESVPALIVDAQVYRAALGSDGRSIIYVDTANRLFSLPKGETNPKLVIDLSERFGAVSVKAIKWNEQLFNTADIWLNRGAQDELWTTSASAASLGRIFNPNTSPPIDESATVTLWEERTKDVSFDVWKVPDPESFE